MHMYNMYLCIYCINADKHINWVLQFYIYNISSVIIIGTSCDIPWDHTVWIMSQFRLFFVQ